MRHPVTESMLRKLSSFSQRNEPVAYSSWPCFLSVHHGIPTLVHGPSFQGVKYSSDAPSTHHLSWQPILSDEANREYSEEIIYIRNLYFYLLKFDKADSSIVFSSFRTLYYISYLAGMDILHGFWDFHCWGAQVSAIFAIFFDGELWDRNEYSSLWRLLLFFVIDVVH